MNEILAEDTYYDDIGKKKLSVYLFGVILCVILTLISFFTTLYSKFSVSVVLAIVFISAVLQFIVQLICFLQLNGKSERNLMYLMSLVFTLVLLFVLVGGSLWIIWSLRYYMTT
ncbi:cytochrome o ubiquinol oxidase subunit IV [Coxiella endosymbiont of Amblyomma nuttalli]|uniref:cytochrome o ubiquinol oxidase subunit IV n=1 Tax=Coxiella endosymbiont of Amblyomma nuttalli TaxID=2749996 RepID=UPI001BB70869|nr:Cytochrome bo(3) ubiquinol oxidase subunit 4 [Coxiella endosymbiont of Amblyomma nuttalli]